MIEAPTDRLLLKALGRVPDDGRRRRGHAARGRSGSWSRPSSGPTPSWCRPGSAGWNARANAVLDLVPGVLPAGLVIASARTYTRDYQDALVSWSEAGVPVWGTIPERVAIAAGPSDWLSAEGVECYRNVWRRLQRAMRA